MLNYIWAVMILVGIIFGALTGKMKEITEAAINSAGEAVALCITMLGVMAFWVGLMEIAEKSGLIRKLTRGISPIITFLFPNLPKDHVARDSIATNMIANIFGLGWAATPAGLQAMGELAKLEEERYIQENHKTKDVHKSQRLCGELHAASDEMCTFLIINISSLQLIPVNIIAYRSQYGSVNPAAVIGPGLLATICSTLAAVVFCKVMMKKSCHK